MEKLSASKDVAEHKLIILYILEKLGVPIGSIELTNYVLEERVLDFLALRQRVHELIESGHIAGTSANGGGYYEITGAGKSLLSGMADMLPQTERNRVDRTVKKLRRDTIDRRAVTAEHVPAGEGGDMARIGLSEGGLRLLNLEIAAASREEAALICDNWKTFTAEIYAEIVGLLLRRRQGCGKGEADGEGEADGKDEADGEDEADCKAAGNISGEGEADCADSEDAAGGADGAAAP